MLDELSYEVIILIGIVVFIISYLIYRSSYTINHMDDLITYVIHYTPLKERKYFQLRHLDKLALNYHFIEDFDREKLSDEDLKIFNTNKVKLSMCSNIRKHIDAYKNIINNEYKYSLILEDDAILDKDFVSKLKRGLKQLPDDYDMLFLGNCCNLHIESSKIKPNQFIYKKSRENGGTRCTDSYLVSKKGATKLINYISKLKEGSINMPSDFWLNQVIRDLQLEIYWMEPTIVTQGSETGKFKSTH